VSNATRGVGDSGDSASFSSFQSSLPGERDTAGNQIREGLPATYRMRADPHYVDQLDSTPALSLQMVRVQAIETGEETPPPAVPALVESVRTYGVLEPLLVQKRDRRYRLIAGSKRLAAAMAAGIQEVPCIVHPIGDDDARVLAAALKVAATSGPDTKSPASQPADLRGPNLSMLDEAIAGSLSAVISSTTLLSESGPRLARTVAIDMIRAEARRALCLLHSARELRYGLPPDQRIVSPAAVVQHVVDMLLPEAQLRGIAIDSSVNVTEGSQIHVNEELLAHALCGAALMITAPLNAFHGPRVKVAAAGEPAGRVTLSVMQQSVAVPRSWPAAPEGPEAYALVPILALRHIAEAAGGRLSTTRLSDGTRVALELPLTRRQA
jgi:hypothetical protein